MTQRFDRVEPGSAPGGVPAEQYADADGHEQRQEDRRHMQLGRQGRMEYQRRQRRYAEDDHEPQEDAAHAADAGLHDGFDEELKGDVAAFGAEGAANADLARALGHRREHDVHDADAADHERDGRNQDEEHLVAVAGAFGFLEPVERDRDGPVLLVMAGQGYVLQPVADRDARVLDRLHPFALGLLDFQRDLVVLDGLAAARAGLADEDGVAEAAQAGAKGDIDVVVVLLGGLGAAGAAGRHAVGHDADYHIMMLVDDHGLAERILEGEQAPGDFRAQDADVP